MLWPLAFLLMAGTFSIAYLNVLAKLHAVIPSEQDHRTRSSSSSGLILSPVEEELECEDLYGTDLIMHWRENAKELCTSHGFHPLLENSVVCYRAGHVGAHNKFTPETCRFHNLVKVENGWTTTCPFDMKREKNRFNARWSQSGSGPVLEKMHLQTPRKAELTECRHVERRSALMFMRESGLASNVFHEMAQILAFYITKHVHGIGDDVKPSDMLLVGFDRHQRSGRNGFVGVCDELLAAFSNQAVLYDEGIPSNTCFSNAMVAFAGEESIAFWHKFAYTSSCYDSPIMKSFVSFALRGIGIEPVTAPPRTTKLCWVVRGGREGHKRGMIGEEEFVANLTNANRGRVDVQVANFGSSNESLRSQILFSQKCNIMVGAHGTGLTHSLWMPTESVVVEILPKGSGSYRTLVRTMGHQYLHVPARGFSVIWSRVKDVVDAAVHLAANMHLRREEHGLVHDDELF